MIFLARLTFVVYSSTLIVDPTPPVPDEGGDRDGPSWPECGPPCRTQCGSQRLFECGLPRGSQCEPQCGLPRGGCFSRHACFACSRGRPAARGLRPRAGAAAPRSGADRGAPGCDQRLGAAQLRPPLGLGPRAGRALGTLGLRSCPRRCSAGPAPACRGGLHGGRDLVVEGAAAMPRGRAGRRIALGRLRAALPGANSRARGARRRPRLARGRRARGRDGRRRRTRRAAQDGPGALHGPGAGEMASGAAARTTRSRRAATALGLHGGRGGRGALEPATRDGCDPGRGRGGRGALGFRPRRDAAAPCRHQAARNERGAGRLGERGAGVLSRDGRVRHRCTRCTRCA